MREEAENEKLLVRYLLGDLPEDQRLQVEERFLGEDQHYERLLALEDELFYDYAQGKLSPGERKQFEERFLVSERNSKRAMLASALVRKMSEAAPAETAEPGLANRERQFWWQTLKSYFRVQSTAARFSLTAVAIMLLVSIWLVIGIVKLRNEFNKFRDQRAVEEDRLHQQAQQESARADDLNLKLKREIDETVLLRLKLSKMQARFQERGQRLPSVISLVLKPSFIRDQVTGMKKLHIPPGVRLLKLNLNLKVAVGYKSYQVTLLTADGAERWSQDRLQAKSTGSGQAIILSLPSRLLGEGDYELRLEGYVSDGTLEETGDYYYFSIVR